MCGVVCRGGRRRRHGLRHAVQLAIILFVHGLAIPIGAALGGHAETNVVERLEKIGGDFVRAILVSHHRGDSHLPRKNGSAFFIGLRELRVEPFQDALRHARHMAKPRGCAQYQNVRAQHLVTQLRPLVAVPHVVPDTGMNVVVDAPDAFAVHAVVAQHFGQLVGEHFGAGVLARALQAAHQTQRAQWLLDNGHALAVPTIQLTKPVSHLTSSSGRTPSVSRP
ncbi:Uncharacterised protein [Mycobacteroides abscessus subsp. abscessus]|nr:Uncharacterised protein [Mycobacteroides abscessus subsp. abscessus]